MTREEPSKQKIQKSLNNYARYSGLAIQMGVVILLGTLGGLQLDKLVNIKFPLFTVSLSFLSVILAIYLGVKDLIGTKNDKTK